MKTKTKNLNRLSKVVVSLRRWPKSWRSILLNFAIRRTIKFVGTAKVDVDMLDFNRAIVSLKNRQKVQNHIGTIHATAMALIAETATGLLVGMNIPDDKTPVLKSMKIDYLKRATGNMRAEAHIKPEQIALIRTEPKGEVLVTVRVTDEEHKKPIECEMLWAWTSKRKK